MLKLNSRESIVNLLCPIETPLPSGLKGVDCIYVINLDERHEKWEYAKKCFTEQNLGVNRVSAINGWKIPIKNRKKMTHPHAPRYLTGGAFGCLLSHVSIYKDAVAKGFKTVWICEDDIAFKDSSEKLSALLQQLDQLDPEWDILYTDFTQKSVAQYARPGQLFYKEIHEPISDELLRIHGRCNTHSMVFSRRGLIKALEYFSQNFVYSPIDVDIHYVPGIREYSTKNDIVTSIYDSSIPVTDGSSDTQSGSPLNPRSYKK